MKTAIVTCVSENWLAPACVTLLSVMRNLDTTKADLIIVADQLSAQSIANVTAFEARHKVKISLSAYQAKGFASLDAHRYSSATFLRLCLPEIISQKYQRLLYLDSDVLALADLSPLLNIDLDGKTLGAVPEVKMAHRRGVITDRHRRRIGLAKTDDYFNAGVLLFDWPKTCKDHLLENARDMLLSGKHLQFLDQDALNLAAKNKWKALPLKWNVEQSAESYLKIAPALRHFNHAAKPWAWPSVAGYPQHSETYISALSGLQLESFLREPKKGNPLLANIEFLWRRLSLHQTRFLRKRYAHLL